MHVHFSKPETLTKLILFQRMPFFILFHVKVFWLCAKRNTSTLPFTLYYIQPFELFPVAIFFI